MDGREESLMAFNLADMVNNRKKPTETENISDTVYRDVFELEPSKENSIPQIRRNCRD